MTDFEALLGTPDRNRVEHIVVGGAAALAELEALGEEASGGS